VDMLCDDTTCVEVEASPPSSIDGSSEYCTRYRSDERSPGVPADPSYVAPRFNPLNEILPDLVFTPGTKIEYFITANFSATPWVLTYLPDTVGKNYYEFEILPSFRTVEGVDKFPCTLYINADDEPGNLSGRYFFEQALWHAYNPTAPAGAPIPDPAPWDRYDYGDAASNWNGPFYRGLGGNSGATIPQMLGYKTILLNTGNLDKGCMEPRDFQGFQQWLGAPICGQLAQQSFLANGSNISGIINAEYPSFLTGNLGAAHDCDSYHASGCPTGEPTNDDNYCVRLIPAAGSPFGAAYTPIDLFANWCPHWRSYNAVRPTGGGVGNMEYEKIGTGVRGQFSSVRNDDVAGSYRTLIDDQSLHMMIVPDGTGNPGSECTYSDNEVSDQKRIDAGTAWLTWTLNWLQDTSHPDGSLCVNPCDVMGVQDQDGDAVAVTRLYQNHPNPFNPRTEIKFSLATDGPARIIIYDVNGRRIRTLVDGVLKAGMQRVIWDGADDSGHSVTSGVYWSQLYAGHYTSNKKMIVLK
jgi:hypothetical protein